MTRWRVTFAPSARRQVREAVAWWIENRRDAPTLLVDELDEVVGLLATSPHVGIAYEAYKSRPLRRLFLPGSGYHVYYAIDERRGRVTVRALWHGRRGSPPSF